MNGSPSFAPLGFPAPTHLGRVEQQIFLCVGTEAGFLSSALPDGMEPWPWWPSGAVFLSFTHATHCHFGPLPVDRLGFLEASVSVPVVKPGRQGSTWPGRPYFCPLVLYVTDDRVQATLREEYGLPARQGQVGICPQADGDVVGNIVAHGVEVLSLRWRVAAGAWGERGTRLALAAAGIWTRGASSYSLPLIGRRDYFHPEAGWTGDPHLRGTIVCRAQIAVRSVVPVLPKLPGKLSLGSTLFDPLTDLGTLRALGGFRVVSSAVLPEGRSVAGG